MVNIRIYIDSNWYRAFGGNVGYHGSEWIGEDNFDERHDDEKLREAQGLREVHGEWEDNQEERVDELVRLYPTARPFHRHPHS